MVSPPTLKSLHRAGLHSTKTFTGSLFIFIWLFSCSSAAVAQGSGRSNVGTGGIHTIQGYVFFPSGRIAEGPIQVKLQCNFASELSLTADSGGQFVFTQLAPGNYTVVVEAGSDYEISRETVFIDNDVNTSRMGIPSVSSSRRYTVMVHLQLKPSERTRAAVVDASLAGVPDNARKLYDTALVQSKANETSKAIENLKAAIAIYPQFTLAINELGVQYLKLGKAEKAVEALNNAIQLAPNAFTPRLNLGIALLEARQFSDAKEQLNEAVKRNVSAPTPHMYLGLALAHLGNNDEAEKELLTAAGAKGTPLPLAHYYLGGLYWKKRDYPHAVEQLEKYLQLSPNAPDADRVRTTIKDLRSKM